MPATPQLTEEQIEEVVKKYEELRTYAGVSRETGLTSLRVKQIVQDRLDIKPNNVKRKLTVYLSPNTILPEEPKEKAFMDFSIVAKNLQKELVENNGLL